MHSISGDVCALRDSRAKLSLTAPAVLLLVPIAYVCGFVGAMPMAGPVALLVISRAVQGRFRPAMAASAGGAVAETCYAFAAFFGFTSLFARHPLIVPMSRAVACVVLVLIGARFAFWKLETGEPRDEGRNERASSFVLAFSASIVNPTLLASWSAVTATIYSTGWIHVSRWGALPFALAAGGGNFSWSLVLLALLRKYRTRFHPNVLTWVVRVMGVILVGVGIAMGIKVGYWVREQGGAGEVGRQLRE